MLKSVKKSVKTMVNKRFNSKSEFAFFIFSQVFISITLIVLVLYTFVSFYKISRDDTISIGEKAVYETSEKLGNFLIDGMGLLSVTTDTVDYMMNENDSTETVKKYLENISSKYSKQNKSFLNVHALIDKTYINGLGNYPKDYLPKSKKWFISAIRAGGKVAITSPTFDDETGKIFITVSKMLSDFTSVIAIDVAMDGIQDFAKEITLKSKRVSLDDCYGFIIDKNSLFVAHSYNSFVGKNALKDSSISNELRELVGAIIDSSKNKTGKSEHYVFYVDNEEHIAFSRNVLEDWYVVIVVKSKVLFKRIQINFFWNIVVVILTICAIIYFCYQSFKRKVDLQNEVDRQSKLIREDSDKMITMQSSVIEGLATLIEERDGNTGEHIKNTKRYALMIASMLRAKKMYPQIVTREFIRNIGNAAPLHDVGKITVPDSILLKEGKFDQLEMETMKQHTIQGGIIIRRIFEGIVDNESFQMALDVAIYHHERWDGKGYPHNLKDTEIPLSARILAVADCFDALVSKRCYKEPIPPDIAFRMIESESGTHFDPEIVKVFLQLRQRIENYLARIEISKRNQIQKLQQNQLQNKFDEDDDAEELLEV